MDSSPTPNLKQKFKSFFKTKTASESGLELLQYFIIPFSRGMKRSGVDDVIAAFFSLDNRRFFYAKAIRDFKLPGKFFVTGNRPIYGLGPRFVRKGQKMLIVVDQVDGTAKVELDFDGEPHDYLLERFEFETMKDWIEVYAEG